MFISEMTLPRASCRSSRLYYNFLTWLAAETIRNFTKHLHSCQLWNLNTHVSQIFPSPWFIWDCVGLSDGTQAAREINTLGRWGAQEEYTLFALHIVVIKQDRLLSHRPDWPACTTTGAGGWSILVDMTTNNFVWSSLRLVRSTKPAKLKATATTHCEATT